MAALYDTRLALNAAAAPEMHPQPRPYPPLWYATTMVDRATWAGEHGINLMGLGPLNGHVAEPTIGLQRQIVVAPPIAELDQGHAPPATRRGAGELLLVVLRVGQPDPAQSHRSLELFAEQAMPQFT